MNRFLALVIFCGLTTAAFALNIPPAPPAPVGGTNGKFIVHEWGTFTGFAGSDGVHLPFGIAIGSELPSFVLTRREQAVRQGLAKEFWFDAGKGGGVLALQRMETPVVYFYTDKPLTVTAKVDFPHGLLSEFYPPVRSMTPAFGDGPGEYYQVERPKNVPQPKSLPPAKLENSSLDWGQLLIIPQVAGERPMYMPEASKLPGGGAHYQYARETDAATVQFTDRPGEQHDERFLFYRGLGDFSLPVKLTAGSEGRFELTNSDDRPIPFALLLNVSDGRARFTIYRDVTGTQSMTLPPLAQAVSIDEVGEEIVRGLIAEGLFEKEARAMVKTWRSHWLGEAGTRVLYTLPRGVTDRLLPLKITPTPDETARVLVGRLDILTPAQERKLQELLAAAPELKALAAEDAHLLRDLGRFLDPALERAVNLRGSAAKDPKRERNALRSLYWNLPRPVAAGG
jgi:hypothetical protein